MLKLGEQIGLQVVAAVGAHPGPAHQVVEARIGPIEGGSNGFSHGGEMGP